MSRRPMREVRYVCTRAVFHVTGVLKHRYSIGARLGVKAPVIAC